jgi:hypothetical protein
MATKKPKADAAPAVALPAAAPNSTDLMAEVTTVFDGLCVTVIDSPMMFELAATELVELQEKFKALEEQRYSITRPMETAKKNTIALFAPALARLSEGITSIKSGMLVYKEEQKRKAAVQQALLDKIADGQRAVLEAEAARQAEEARAQSALAAQLMASGDSAGVDEALTAAENAQAMAAALAQTTQVVSSAVADTGVPNVIGITSAEVWKARITDTAVLLRFIADHPEYHDWIEFKMTGLHDMAKAQRDALRVPGVEPFEESRIAARRKAA